MRPGLLIAALFLTACGTGTPATDTTTAVETVAYGDHPSQQGTLHLPEGDGPAPVVVLLHGGFWLERYGANLMTQLAEDLTDRGYAVWNLEYRRIGGGGGWPETFADAAAGIDHLAEIGGDRLDLDRVTTLGHSAGGHLALWLAARPGLPSGAVGADPDVVPVRALGQAAVSDLVAAARRNLGGGATQELMGGDPDAVPGRYELGNPIRRLPLGVPQMLVHAADDRLVPPEMSRRYAEAAAEAGDDVTLEIVRGDHFVHLDPTSEAWQRVLDLLDAGEG